VNDLHTTSFASTTSFNLSFNNNGAANLGCCCFCFFWGVCGYPL
jgi:hypothetical protein